MIEGKETYLRAIEEGDLKPLLQWRNQPNFRKYFREYRELSWDQQLSWYKNIVLKDDKVRMFSIVRRDDDALLGACGLCYIDPVNRNADFSIYIGKDNLYIDKKYAIDAANILMAYGFDELNLHRVWAEIYSIDKAKIEFFKTLNFTQEGVHRETHWTDGHWVNSIFYSMLRDEYQKAGE